MKNGILSLLAASMMFQMTACQKGQESAETKSETAVADKAPAEKALEQKDPCADVTVESLTALVKDKKEATVDEYAEILKGLSCCKINEKNMSLDRQNCVAEQAIKALKASKTKLPKLSAVAERLIYHDSPIVRGRVYSSFSGIFGSTQEEISLAKKAMKIESDPYALQELVSGLSNEGNKDPEVAQFLLRMAKHENHFVRRKAASALGNTWSDKVEGAADTVISMFADSDDTTAKIACAGAGKLMDEKVIAPIVQILNDPAKEKLHPDCVRGLSIMWLDFPFHKNHNEAAYKATMEYLKKTPRTDKIPAWNAVNAFNSVSNLNGAFEEWKKNASWFKLDEFTAVMTDLIKDDAFIWLGKGPAMKAIASLGGKAELEKIKPVIDALTDEKIKKAYAQELEKAK